MFNDNEVMDVPQKELENKAFGGSDGPCAYLLFYTRRNAKFSIGDKTYGYGVKLDMSEFVDQTIRSLVSADNQEMLQLQAAFSPNLFDFVIALRDPNVLLKYYLHIFCHSHKRQKVGQIQSTLLNSIADKQEEAFSYIDSQHPAIQEIIMNCTQEGILDSLAIVLDGFINHLPVSVLEGFFDFILSSFLAVPKTAWRQMPVFAKILHGFASSHIDYVVKKDWLHSLLSFVQGVYAIQQSMVASKNIDLGYIFSIFALLAGSPNASELVAITSCTTSILASVCQADPFISFVFALSEHGHIDLKAFMPALMNAAQAISEDLFFRVITQAMLTTQTDTDAGVIVTNALLVKHIPAPMIVTRLCLMIREGHRRVRAFFLQFPNSTVLSVLTHPERAARMAGEHVAAALFSMIEPPQAFLYFGVFGPQLPPPPPQYTGLTSENRLEMFDLVSAIFQFLQSEVIPRISLYSLSEYRLMSLLAVLEWYLGVLNEFSADKLEILDRLYIACASVKQPCDQHIAMIAQLYGHFPKEMVCAKAIPAYRLLFDNESSMDPTETFIRLWTFLVICGESVWLRLFEESTFSRVFTAICSFPFAAVPTVRQLCDSAFPLLGTNGKVKDLFIKLFTDDPGKVMAYAPEALFPLFLELQPELPRHCVSNFISFVFRQILDNIDQVMHSKYRNILLSALTCGERLITSVTGDFADFELSSGHVTRIVSGYEGLQDDECGIKCRAWMTFWAKRLPGLYAEMFDSFRTSLRDSSTLAGPKLITEWARFQLSISFKGLREIFDCARAHSDGLTKYLFRVLAGRLNHPEMVAFARSLTADIFDTERLATKSIVAFFACGLREMDVDSVIALFATACDQVGDLQTIDERRAVAKATLIIEVRPDMKGTLVAFFPIQDKEQLAQADMLYAAELLFGNQGCTRVAQDQTSDDDLGPGQDFADMFDTSIGRDRRPECDSRLDHPFIADSDVRLR
jgi:hypothetical protein